MRSCFAVLLIFIATNCFAQDSKDVFSAFSQRVVQIRVVEESSRGKASIGSGFYISADGLIVSNYHVVSSFVLNPERFRIDLIDQSENNLNVELIYVDVVHDLALLKVEKKVESYFDDFKAVPKAGERIYSIGNPQDLGFTIVEGIYNGPVKESRLQKLNFSGSLNPGMSGGAAFNSEGKLVGVNVSTAGNQLSFLVPAAYVHEMIESYNKGSELSNDFLKLAEKQIYEDQKQKFETILATPFAKVSLKDYSVPSALLPSLKCWSDSEEKKEEQYQYLNHVCSTSELIFLSPETSVGNLYVYYLLVENKGLNPFSFSSKIQHLLSTYTSSARGNKEDFSNYKCIKNFVNPDSKNGPTFWINACMRRYQKFDSLYDLTLVGAAVDSSKESLVFYSNASAVSFDNAQKLTKKFLENITWKQ
jgi:serine protease Do